MRYPVADDPGQRRLHNGNASSHQERCPVEESCGGCCSPKSGRNSGQEQPGHQRPHRPELGDEQRSRHGCSGKEERGEGREKTNPRLGKVEILVNQGNDRRDRKDGHAQSSTRQPQQDEGNQEFLGSAGVFCLTHRLAA
jgi:hypothetical protein